MDTSYHKIRKHYDEIFHPLEIYAFNENYYSIGKGLEKQLDEEYNEENFTNIILPQMVIKSYLKLKFFCFLLTFLF